MKDKEKIIDFISGKEVANTPEEVHAVQVFAKSLVQDYDYPKEHIRTRPQWRVKARPSDEKKNIRSISPYLGLRNKTMTPFRSS